MQRWLPPAALGAAVLLAGCLAAPAAPEEGPPSSPGDAAAPGGPVRFPWDLLDCDYLYGSVGVEAARVRPLLAPGLEPFPVGGPSSGAPWTRLNFEADRCARGAGLHGPVEGMVYAMVSVPVVVPPELEVEGFAGGYYQTFDLLVPDEDRRALLQGHGLAARAGDVAHTTLGLDGAALQRAAVVELEGLGTIRVEATAPAQPRQVGGEFVDYHLATGGLFRSRTTWATASYHSGPGTVEVPAGTWIADLLGGTEGQGTFMVGRWSYTDGHFEGPIPWPRDAANGPAR